jgi:hypothetical protein
MLQINQAAVYGELDRYSEAIESAAQVRRLADEAGNVVRLAQAQSVLGELLFEVGHWDDALAEVLDPVPVHTRQPVVHRGDDPTAPR